MFDDEEYGRFDGKKLTERWSNVAPNSYWRHYGAFMNLQNAFDSALMSYKVKAPSWRAQSAYLATKRGGREVAQGTGAGIRYLPNKG